VQVSLASKPPTALGSRWLVAAAIVLAIAAALSVATFSRTNFAKALSDAASDGLDNVKTVAAMLADRSPGQRPEGALASLKHKKQSILHERALPKVRKAESPLAGIVGTPPVPPIEMAPETPLYSMVSAAPDVVPPTSIVPGAAPPGSNAPPPGGGGGIVVPPGTTDTPSVPTTPVTPAVPEPATWAMMLVGFAMVGWAIRRDKRTASQPASA
jgi:hypothetical protein